MVAGAERIEKKDPSSENGRERRATAPEDFGVRILRRVGFWRVGLMACAALRRAALDLKKISGLEAPSGQRKTVQTPAVHVKKS